MLGWAQASVNFIDVTNIINIDNTITIIINIITKVNINNANITTNSIINT